MSHLKIELSCFIFPQEQKFCDRQLETWLFRYYGMLCRGDW